MASIDPTELSTLFDAHAGGLALYARQWLEPAAAEDVVQEVFVQLMAQRRPPDKVKAWLFRSVRNAAISELRRRRRRQKHEVRSTAGRAGWFEDRPEALIDGATVEASLASLPDEDREIVMLRIWGQMTLQEIADTVGSSVSTVFHHYRAGLAAIRRKLESSCRAKNG